MTKPNISADIAAFLAKGGTITVCAIGERSDVIERTIAEQQAMERGIAAYGSRPVYPYTPRDLTRERVDAGYAVFNGQGEALYLGA